jgi:hypothetical protein
MAGVMQHPVPAKLLVHIGVITVSFALVEMQIQSLIGSLIREHQRVGQIITAELSFKGLRALAVSLYMERHGEDADFKPLRELMNRAAKVEETRNQIAHSIWASGDSADSITRIKTTAKEHRGIHFSFQNMGERELEEIALEMKKLSADIQQYYVDLLIRGKCINSPAERLW